MKVRTLNRNDPDSGELKIGKRLGLLCLQTAGNPPEGECSRSGARSTGRPRENDTRDRNKPLHAGQKSRSGTVEADLGNLDANEIEGPVFVIVLKTAETA